MIFLWGSSGIFFLICIIGILKMKKIERMLIPIEGEGLNIDMDYNLNINIPVPLYLKGSIPPPNGDLLFASIYLLKYTCSYIFIGVYPNRHQLLF